MSLAQSGVMLRYHTVVRSSRAILSAILLLAMSHVALSQQKPVAKTPADLIIAQQHEALALYTNGKYQETLDLLLKNEPRARAEFGEFSENRAWVLNLIANSYQAIYRNNEAIAYYKQALAIREKVLGPHHVDVARSLNDLGGFYKTLTRHAEAEQMIRRALAIREKAFGPENADVAQTVNDLGDVHVTLGQYALAESQFKRAIAIREKVLGPDDPYTAESLVNLASLYNSLGRYGEAETITKRTIAIWERASGPNHRTVAYGLISIAYTYIMTDRFREAEVALKRAIANFEGAFGPDHPDVASPLSILATVYRKMGRYDQVEPLLNRALAIRERVFGREHPDVAATLNEVANYYFETGRYNDAIQVYIRVSAIFEKVYGRDHSEVAVGLSNLGAANQRAGRHTEAEPPLQRALAIREKNYGPEHPVQAVTLYNLGKVAFDLGKLADAGAFHQRALALRQKIGPDRLDVADSLTEIAQVALKRGDLPGAINHVRQSARIMTGFMERDQKRADGDALPVLRKFHDSLLVMRRALDAGSREAGLPAESFELAQWAGQSAAATALAQMAVRFGAGNDALAGVVRAQQDTANELQAADKLLLAEMSKASGQRDRAREERLRATIAPLDARLDQLRKRIELEFPRYSELISPKPLPPSEVQRLIAPDEAFLLFHVSDAASFVWAVTRERVEWREIVLSRGEIEALVAGLRASLDPSETPDHARPFDFDAAYRLYAATLGPVEGAILAKRHIIVVPSGALSRLPLQVLVTSKPQKRIERSSDYGQAAWLVHRHAVTVLPSVASLRTLREIARGAPAPKPYLGFGDPVFNPGAGTPLRAPGKPRVGETDTERLSRALAPLPDTADELRAVAKIIGAPLTDIRLGKEATERAVRAVRLSDYRILHFATHALVANETALFAAQAEPALALALPLNPSEQDDGLLTSSEVATLRLNADWVILSACNTAAGDKPDAEALSGLARAFFYAGAKTLLVSHWPVRSDAAVKLTTNTIQTLERDKSLSPAEALRRAMVDFLGGDGSSAHPANWAPFVIVGTTALRQ
jgi:CHAT domain-containing protein/Tfp pilus assembly protein PilF